MYEIVLITLLGALVIDELISVYFTEKIIFRLDRLNKNLNKLTNSKKACHSKTDDGGSIPSYTVNDSVIA